jgi:hypothetical protein
VLCFNRLTDLLGDEEIVSLPESILLSITVIVFVIMLLKQYRVLYFFAWYTINSIVLFALRVIDGDGVASAFFDSFGLVGIGMLIFFVYYIKNKFLLKDKEG